MLVTSIFSFSNNVLNRLLYQDRWMLGLSGKWLTLDYYNLGHFLRKSWSRSDSTKCELSDMFFLQEEVNFEIATLESTVWKLPFQLFCNSTFITPQNFRFVWIESIMNKLKMWQKCGNLYLQGQKTMWKSERKLVYELFPLFPQCFRKDSLYRSFTGKLLFVYVLELNHVSKA